VTDLFEGFTFTTGAVRSSHLAYLIGTKPNLVEQRIAHSRCFSRNRGNWGANNLNWMACSATVSRDPERFWVLGTEGQILVVGGGQILEESPIADGEDSPVRRGPLREMRAINGRFLVAVGTLRQAYLREAKDRWRCIDHSMREKGVDLTNKCLESVDGLNDSEIYAVGWDGEIWHFDGQSWSQTSSPTNLALYKVRCATDGWTYACGQVGTIVRGRGQKWEVIEQDETKEDFWGMECFNGKVYLSTMHRVFELDASGLRKVDFGEDPPLSCYHLSGADGVLWSIGSRDVLEFNGDKWSRIR
jgi:hypothetical protein